LLSRCHYEIVQVNRIERDPKAREGCIRLFGAQCSVCGLEFEKSYGDIGSGFIHVHHLNPIAETKGQRDRVNPRTGLRPVCPNCHEMLYRRTPPFTIEEMKARFTVAMPAQR